MELFDGGSALGTAFLLDVLGAIGNFVVDFFDFEREMKFLGMFCVLFEKRVALGLEVVAFFLPDSCYCQHVNGPLRSVRSFRVYR